jgi:hypothetical protein
MALALVHAQQRLGRRRIGVAAAQVEAQFVHRLDENQVGEIFKHHIQLEHHGADIGVLVDQRQGHAIELGNDRQHAEDGADQFREIAGADDFQIKRLMPGHDGVIALGLFEQVGHTRAQCPVLGRQIMLIGLRRKFPVAVCVIGRPFLAYSHITPSGPVGNARSGQNASVTSISWPTRTRCSSPAIKMLFMPKHSAPSSSGLAR